MNYAIAIIGSLVFLSVVVIFNRLVRSRQLVREAWSGIDVQLKRRHDLVPNLIEIVKGYMNFEGTVLENAARLRSASPQDAHEVGQAQSELTRHIKSLLAVTESYPQLKSSQAVCDLQKSLVEVEDDIQYARRYYNGTVRDNNILVQSFPSNVIAALFGFESQPFFEIEYATERRTPDVAFS